MWVGREHYIGPSVLRHHFLCIYTRAQQITLHTVCPNCTHRLTTHGEGFPFVLIAASLVKLLPKHMAGLRPGEEASRNSAAINDVSEYPGMKFDEDTAGEDEDKKEITAGTHCSTTHKSLLGHSPLAVTVCILLEYTWGNARKILKCSIICKRSPDEYEYVSEEQL